MRLLALLSFTSLGVALAQPPTPPTPGPEQKRIGYFVGDWTEQGEMKPGPFGPGGKFSQTSHNTWFPGGFFLLMHTDVTSSPMGNGKSLGIMGYSKEEKAYTFYAVASDSGEAINARGTISGDTWNWMTESKMNGQTINTRVTIQELPPDGYTFKVEMSGDGGKTWNEMMSSKATRVKTAKQ